MLGGGRISPIHFRVPFGKKVKKKSKFIWIFRKYPYLCGRNEERSMKELSNEDLILLNKVRKFDELFESISVHFGIHHYISVNAINGEFIFHLWECRTMKDITVYRIENIFATPEKVSDAFRGGISILKNGINHEEEIKELEGLV